MASAARHLLFAFAATYALMVPSAALAAAVRPSQAESSQADPAALRLDIDWPSFLARHDLVWHVLPHQWNEGAFLGNGQLGLVAHARPADNRFDFHLGRVDVTDHRKAPDRKTSRGVDGAGVMYDFPRLHIGRMVLHPAGKITGGSLRQHLWNAEITGVIETDLGRLELRVVTLRDRMVNRIDVLSTERDATGRPQPWRWEFLPGNPASPRAQVFPDRPESKAYVTNPPPRLASIDGVPACIQPLLAGGDFATAWLDLRPGPDSTSGTLLFTTANEVPAADASGPLAVRTLRSAAAALDADLAAHRAWWHAFYPDAFLTVPDARLESFYWIQIFKLAASSRPDGPPIDVLGPFFRVTQWPGLWWNLNVQLTYWPVYGGNRLALGENLLTELDKNFDFLFSSFANTPKIGDFAWVLHNYWLHLRHAGDWKNLHARWTPKARLVLENYLARLVPTANGRLDLPATESPEYEGFKSYHNSNYNLALLRWLLSAIPEAYARAEARAPAADLAEWSRVSAALAPYPIDDNGLMIGSDRSVHKSHRHYSHLLALYPLFQLDPDSPADRDLVVKSVRHWHHVGNGSGLVGYSFTGGASLYAALGFGDEAHALLTRFLDNRIGSATLHRNTLYTESGGRNPVIETPLSGASAATELIFQSWGGKLRVFPAIPSTWSEAAFHQLRGQGGFLVSAARSEGRTRWVHVLSEVGEPCVVKVPDWTTVPTLISSRPLALETIAPGEYRLDLRRGETVLLRAPDFEGPALLQPLPVATDKANPFGLTAATRVARDPSWPEPPLPPAR
jgi:alpha-L-fucosidase 2